jgi:hypothetical protein
VGAAHSEIVSIFGHVPDAVTYYDEDEKPCAAWHEVELSRRSVSGTKKLRHLVHTLIEKRYLTHDGREHNINLVLHCATAKIERENHRVIQEELAACAAIVQEFNDDARAEAVAYAAKTAEEAEAAATENAEAAEAAYAAEASDDAEASYATEAAAAYAAEAAEAAAAVALDAAKAARATDAAYAVQVGTGDAQRKFSVYINRLPEDVESTWESSLPWPGAPGAVSSKIDVFLRPV